MTTPAHSRATPRPVTIYTDGAASPNPGRGGYGVILLHDGRQRELSGGFALTTNNRMEIMGAIIGLRELAGAPATVTIYSDSKYLVDMFNGGHAARWRRANWTRNKGKDPALNPDLWEELLNLAAPHTVQFVWVRGHASNQGNARCDQLAVAARCQPNLPADPGYGQPFGPTLAVTPAPSLALAPAQPTQLSLFGD